VGSPSGVDSGNRPGLTTEERERLNELERESAMFAKNTKGRMVAERPLIG